MCEVKLMKISGNRVIFSPSRGEIVTNEKCVIYTPVHTSSIDGGYFGIGKIYNFNNWHIMLQQSIPMTKQTPFSMFRIKLSISYYTICDNEDIKLIDSILAKYNLRFTKFNWLRYNNIRKEFTEFTFSGLQYISKDNFGIILNGERFKFSELPNITERVILSWDNGYSYYGSETTDKTITDIVDEIFSPMTEIKAKKGIVFANGRVFCGGHYGWNFNEFGELIVRTSNERISTHIVSNT